MLRFENQEEGGVGQTTRGFEERTTRPPCS